MGHAPERIAAAELPPEEIAGTLPFFVPLTKIDVAKREVYGAAALETRDGTGERCDVLRSIPHFEALAKRCTAESGGRKVAPLREMHQLKAAGNVVEFVIDRTARRIEARSKVTDEAAFQKVLDGTYCGYSAGGKKRLVGRDADGTAIYEWLPTELSLVDLGQVAGTQIALLKAATCEVTTADGAVEERPLLCAAEREDVTEADKTQATKEYGDVTYADPTNKKYPIDTAEHIRAAWSYINQEQNAAKYSSEDAAAIKRKIVAAWKKTIDEAGPPAAESMAKVSGSLDEFRQAVEQAVHAFYGEDDDGCHRAWARDIFEDAVVVTVDAKLMRHSLVRGADGAVALGADGVAVRTVYLPVEGEGQAAAATRLAMAAALGDLAKADAMRGMTSRVQRMHDLAVDLGAACGSSAPTTSDDDERMEHATRTDAPEVAVGQEDSMETQELTKTVRAALGFTKDEDTLEKVIGGVVTPKLESLEKAIGGNTEKVASLEARLKAAEEKLEKVAASPGPTGVHVLTKGQDAAAAGVTGDAVLDDLAKHDPRAAMAAVQRMNGRRLTTDGFAPLS